MSGPTHTASTKIWVANICGEQNFIATWEKGIQRLDPNFYWQFFINIQTLTIVDVCIRLSHHHKSCWQPSTAKEKQAKENKTTRNLPVCYRILWTQKIRIQLFNKKATEKTKCFWNHALSIEETRCNNWLEQQSSIRHPPWLCLLVFVSLEGLPLWTGIWHFFWITSQIQQVRKAGGY